MSVTIQLCKNSPERHANERTCLCSNKTFFAKAGRGPHLLPGSQSAEVEARVHGREPPGVPASPGGGLFCVNIRCGREVLAMGYLTLESAGARPGVFRRALAHPHEACTGTQTCPRVPQLTAAHRGPMVSAHREQTDPSKALGSCFAFLDAQICSWRHRQAFSGAAARGPHNQQSLGLPF